MTTNRSRDKIRITKPERGTSLGDAYRILLERSRGHVSMFFMDAMRKLLDDPDAISRYMGDDILKMRREGKEWGEILEEIEAKKRPSGRGEATETTEARPKRTAAAQKKRPEDEEADEENEPMGFA